MSTLVVTAHPDPDSLTHHVARRLAGSTGATLAHLAQEGFDPRFTLEDRRVYLGEGAPAADVAAEQRRIDAHEHLVLVFPVYWWSMPALLKGWVDRVFIADWAFGIDAAGGVVPRLERLSVHLIPVSGTSERSFERHGYTESFRTQIERGVIGYCGARHGVTAFVHDSEAEDRDATARSVESAVARVAAALVRSAGG
ncbi:flavodoxin family protein [Rathayibacter sp. VKM Ac-2803]|uniref:NAD(P)H-dependent oxidoreductase n=1 Tax=unclassified Rathayibacter TaxID=2609250 RepID=UPI001357D662|nr:MULTISPECIES: NAD(P)H-dependent oxidoreductase [unclassified Rathayibacter]MWV48299.1 flavodoxin family protein [Rathayibacter sp. VKM Ac-2803]MWV59208.1 flavodoxin family protein [Rathayibacter sp. VKM Ac-2754]